MLEEELVPQEEKRSATERLRAELWLKGVKATHGSQKEYRGLFVLTVFSNNKLPKEGTKTEHEADLMFTW